ncbi:restriction endonuclease subunit S [Flavobacterium cheongpyeongense]|uniref:Restriction endonuclease subunit S n=1 Tax=Flavobacterium cheongpyeongense TaxID=2212651 RepID=A0A2V4C2F7_9FLAO|nr:restriction endonuclease subunit S [Flavobacterium cheongpyeongense]PXY40404.1 restriction endonuclease subunit S [Flavobacterium cheongpyeongense]
MSEVKKTPNGWVETTLGEVVERITKGTTPKTFSSNNDDINYIKSDALNYGGFLESNKFVKITNKVNEELKRSQLKVDDILLSMAGEYLGKTGLVKEEHLPANTNQAVAIITVDKNIVDHIFLWYKLRDINTVKYFKSIPSQSAQPNINFQEIRTLSIYLPQISEQKSIASILTAFDDKIQLLQAQNKTLEATAQTIFTEWFGKYQIGDDLPDGWRIFQLNELVDIVNGYSYKGSELVEYSDEVLVTLKSFDRNGGFQTRGFKPFRGNPKENQEVKIGDLVVAHTDLTQDAEVLGNPAFIFDDGGFKKMYITMDLVKVVSIHKDISSSFLYYLMKDKAFKGHCVGYSNGTTVLHLSKKAIPEYQLLLPIDFSLIKRFSEIADSTTTKISLNKTTIKSLTQTRDELLPRLMSGEIRVNEFKN